MHKIKIVLADDHLILMDGLKALFDRQENIEVLAAYDDGLKLYQALENTQPGIAIIDINMPGLNGHELTLRIKKEFPAIKVIILSMFDDVGHIAALVKRVVR